VYFIKEEKVRQFYKNRNNDPRRDARKLGEEDTGVGDTHDN
jgi:hypothetical protein